MPSQELILTPIPDLARPVVIVSESMVAIIAGDLSTARELKVTDEDSYARAASVINALGKNRTFLKERSSKLQEPYNKGIEHIRTTIKSIGDPSVVEEKRIGLEMGAWIDKKEAERKKALDDLKKAQDAEAERKRLADLEKVRLQTEADARLKDAIKDLKKATTEEQFAAAGEKHDAGMEVAGQAASVATGGETPSLTQALAPMAGKGQSGGVLIPGGYTPVKSSLIASVCFEEDCGLFVQFTDGAVWNYSSVNAEKFKAMMAAPSIGKFFLGEIKKLHTGEKMSMKVADDSTVGTGPDAGTSEVLAPSSFALLPAAAGKKKGTKTGQDTEILETNLELLPLTYHEVNEKKLKAHILDGTVTDKTPGVKFRVFSKVTGSGR